MIYRLYLVLFLFVAIFPGCRELKMKEANLTLTKPTLMHTLRETPYPSHQSVSVRNPAVLLWPEQEQYRGLVLDGAETDEVKKAKKFRVRLSQDPHFYQQRLFGRNRMVFLLSLPNDGERHLVLAVPGAGSPF